MTIQATSPLLEARHLDEALEQFEAEECDSMLSVVRTKRFFWNADGTAMNYDPSRRPRRQDFVGRWMKNGAFYITSRRVLVKHARRLGGRVGFYGMPAETAIEIDDPGDWEVVENMLTQRTG